MHCQLATGNLQRDVALLLLHMSNIFETSFGCRQRRLLPDFTDSSNSSDFSPLSFCWQFISISNGDDLSSCQMWEEDWSIEGECWGINGGGVK